MKSRMLKKMHKSPRRRGKTRGFTIVELLVATSITLVILGLMVQVTFSTLQTFERVNGTLSSQGQARAIFDFLRRDFEAMLWRADGKVWLLATVQRDQSSVNGGRGDANFGSGVDVSNWLPANPKPGSANPSTEGSSLKLQKEPNPSNASKRWLDIKDYRFGQAGVWLRFFTMQPTSEVSQASPVAVAYQIIRMRPQPNSADRDMRYLLFRSVVRSSPNDLTNRSVLSAGYTPANSSGNSANATEGCFDLTDDSVDGYNKPTAANSGNGNPGSIRRPDRELILGNNVIDFGVRFWRREIKTVGGKEIVDNKLIFPANSQNQPDNNNLGFAITSRLPAEVKNNGINSGTRAITNRTGASTIPFADAAASDQRITNQRLNTSGETGEAGTDPVGYPDYVEVMVRILTDEGARILAAYEYGDTTAPTSSGAPPTQAERDAYWWALAEQHSVVYTDTINLSARPF